MKKGINILEDHKFITEKELHQHGDYCKIIASSDFIKSQGLSGSKVFKIENYYKKCPHFFSFRKESSELTKYFVNNINTKYPNFNIEKVSPLQVYSGLLTINYFDKVLSSLHLAQYILNKLDVEEIIIDTNESTLAQSIIYEAIYQNIKIKILNTISNPFKLYANKILWFAKELVLSLIPNYNFMKFESDVMFVCSEPYHYVKIISLIKQILSSTNFKITIVLRCTLSSQQYIKNARVNYLNYQDIRGFEYFKMLVFNSKKIKRIWKRYILPEIDAIFKS